jgi:hypothetical protein
MSGVDDLPGPAANTRGAAARQQPAPAAAAGGAAAADAADADEGKAGEQAAAPEPAAAAHAAAAESDADRVELANLRQLMQAMQEKIARLEQQPASQPQPQSLSLDAPAAAAPPQSGSSAGLAGSDVAALIRAMQDSSAAQADQMRQQQAAASAQLILLQSLGELSTFSGKGADTTLTAHDWLSRSEDFFAAREQAMNTTAALSDKARLLNAANALTDDARRWYQSLPARPTTWASFRVAVEARFCSVPSVRIRVDKLQEFVDQAAAVREKKFKVQGLQALTARFAQLAGEVPDTYITLHGKIALLARCLPPRFAEVVLKEDAKEPPPALHEIINTVLSRAANKEQAVAYGGGSSSSGSSSASVDAVSLAAAMLGCSREEAAGVFENDEGWQEHDTSGQSQRAPTGPAAFAGAGRIPDDQMAMLVNAVAAATRVGAGQAARDRAPSRRNVTPGVANEIPSELANARKEAGLCIKCGVKKYEGGSKGHNSRTCTAPADKTTSVAQGRKAAGFQ